MKDLLEKLNGPQREAVLATEGPVLVIAGAGSGKTRVITHRIAYLIEEMGVHPRSIFAATFTNKAANEMKERVRGILRLAGMPYMSIATFHSLCVGILRGEAHLLGLSNRFMIADERDAMTLMTEVLKDLEIGKDQLHPRQALHLAGQLKIRLLAPSAAGAVLSTEGEEIVEALDLGSAAYVSAEAREDMARQAARAIAVYNERLLANDAVDFDDLIGLSVKLFENHPDILAHYQDRYRYLLVDEYQDTNLAQFRLVSLLAGAHENLCVVGDEDQSIYSWRGAELSNLLEFQKHYPAARLIKLEQNYRSTGHVLAAASALIANNTERVGKTLWTDLGDGLPIALASAASDLDEGDGIGRLIERLAERTRYRYSDIAVFYRVKSLSRSYEESMRRYDIPYRVIGGTSFYERTEIRDLLAYLRLCVNPNQTISLLRVINTPRRGVGQKTLDALMARAGTEGKSLFQALLAALADGTLKGKAGVAVGVLCEQMAGWQRDATNLAPTELLRLILADTGYQASLGDPSHLDVRARLANIENLVDGLEEYHIAHPAATIAEWLEQVALENAQDAIDDENRVSLMTLHAAKGLEYPVVIMAGMEDPIFPNRRAADERGNSEEERRLCYVGMTRAERLLVFTHAERRVTHGELRFNPPSPFLREIPQDLIAPLSMIDIARIDDVESGRRGSRAALMAAEAKRAERPVGVKPGGARKPEPEVVYDNHSPSAEPPSPRDRVAMIMALRGGQSGMPTYASLDEEARSEGSTEPEYPAAPPPPRLRPVYGRRARPSIAARRFGDPQAKSSGEAGADPLPWVELGGRVRHDMLGDGKVIGLSGRGRDRKIMIHFDDGDQREMLAAYARLEPLPPEE